MGIMGIREGVISTTLDQRKDLLDSGVPEETADLWRAPSGEISSFCLNPEYENRVWSLSALLELLPPTIEWERSVFVLEINFLKGSISYLNRSEGETYATFRFQDSPELLEATVGMVCKIYGGRKKKEEGDSEY